MILLEPITDAFHWIDITRKAYWEIDQGVITVNTPDAVSVCESKFKNQGESVRFSEKLLSQNLKRIFDRKKYFFFKYQCITGKTNNLTIYTLQARFD